LKLTGQGFDGSLASEAFTRMRGRRMPVHVSLSWRGRRSLLRHPPETRSLVCGVETLQLPAKREEHTLERPSRCGGCATSELPSVLPTLTPVTTRPHTGAERTRVAWSCHSTRKRRPCSRASRI
jgi:hypothetical protein